MNAELAKHADTSQPITGDWLMRMKELQRDFPVKIPDSRLWTITAKNSRGPMGVALGYAIGAKLANGGKIVIAVDGDGSFNMTFTELKTLVEQKIPIKIMIPDNDGQMMVECWQRLFHNNRLLCVIRQTLTIHSWPRLLVSRVCIVTHKRIQQT